MAIHQKLVRTLCHPPPSKSPVAALTPQSHPNRIPVQVHPFPTFSTLIHPYSHYKTIELLAKVKPSPIGESFFSHPSRRLGGVVMASSGSVQKSEEEWRAILSPEQFRILRKKGTEGCKTCGRVEIENGCNGEGRIQGGIATVPGFGWWPIKAFRPCPAFVASGGRYRRQGQSMDEVAFGRGGRKVSVKSNKGKLRYAGTGEYDKFYEEGVYECAGCGTPLYKSTTKFNSGCGWPAFYEGLPGAITRTPDPDGRRIEITCTACGGHLGHVFKGEGFKTPTDERHCVNSISLKFTQASGSN